MFFLAQRWTQNRPAAAFAGIVFAFNGLMLNSLMWPATVAGLGWMPWVVWLTERAWREGGRTLVLAAVAGALQMLSGGTEVTLLTWVLLGTVEPVRIHSRRWSAGKNIMAGRPGRAAGQRPFRRAIASLLRPAGLLAASGKHFRDALAHAADRLGEFFRAAVSLPFLSGRLHAGQPVLDQFLLRGRGHGGAGAGGDLADAAGTGLVAGRAGRGFASSWRWATQRRFMAGCPGMSAPSA